MAWETLASLDVGLYEIFGSAVYDPDNNTIVLFGGFSTSAQTGIRVYDIEQDSWSTVGSLPSAYRYIKAVRVGDTIVVMQGGTSRNTSGTWLVYDLGSYSTPAQTLTSRLTTANTGRAYALDGAFVNYWPDGLADADGEGFFYESTLGGSDSVVEQASTARLFTSTGLIGSTLYLVGGYNTNFDPLTDIQSYDYDTDTLTTFGESPEAEWIRPSSDSRNGQIFLAGGEASGLSIDSVYSFDGATFTELDSLPDRRASGALVATSDGLYYIGGNKDGSAQSTVYFLELDIGGDDDDNPPPPPGPGLSSAVNKRPGFIPIF